MLFYGPPGTGKTYISKRLAEETQLAFCTIKPSDLASVWVHGSQMLIKQLFERAASLAEKNDRGCLLLIDEFDSIAPKRTVEDNSHQAGEVAELLTQLNDCVEKNVYVIGTTNRLDAIDSSILRHGRLDSIVYFNIPDLECRKQLFEIELQKRPHEDNISIDELARLTEGYTSSDISYMVKETARNAFEACLMTDDKHVVKISEKMLREVIAGTRPSVTRDDMRRYEKMRDDYINHSKNERPRIGFLT
jgi:transitional endoplasmic reticulum ATPase